MNWLHMTNPYYMKAIAFHISQILLLSMKDMNIAKLTSNDLPLFNSIMGDLFPGVETPVIDYSKVLFFCYHYFRKRVLLNVAA